MKLSIAVTLLMALYGAASAAKDAPADKSPKLDYAKLGGDWPGLCQTGKEQSPVNVVRADLTPIKSPSGMVKIESLGVVEGANLFVTDKLPHVEMKWNRFVRRPRITVPATKDGDVFAPAKGEVDPENLQNLDIEAAQCHFHTPSENSVDGKLFDGVIHCVHFVRDGESEKCDKIKADGGLGCPVVISVFLQADEMSSPLDKFLYADPKEIVNGPHVKVTGGDNGNDISGRIDLTSFLPDSGEYATWPGSLTTAPCTEGILWVQLLKPLSVPSEQILLLEDTVAFAHGKDCEQLKDGICYPPRLAFNNREIQPLHGRVLRTGSAF